MHPFVIAALIVAVILTVLVTLAAKSVKYCTKCGTENTRMPTDRFSGFTGLRIYTYDCPKCRTTPADSKQPPPTTSPNPSPTTESCEAHKTIVMSPARYLLNTPYENMGWYQDKPKDIVARIRAVNKDLLNISIHEMGDNYSRVEVIPRTRKKT